MVNNSDFIQKVKKILTHYNLSASALADTLSVQRSSISHLLSGRNKPSLDFVLKLSEAFADINIYWLLHGDPHPFLKEDIPVKEVIKEVVVEKQTALPLDTAATALPDLQEPQTIANALANPKKEVEKIMILYTDKSFDIYQN